MKKKFPAKKVICVAVTAVLCAVIVAADCICYQPAMYNSISQYLTGGMKVADAAAKSTSYANSAAVAGKITDEGMVLLKNKDNSLPLKNVSKVNLFGVISANLYTTGGGSGSTQTNGVTVYTLKDSFNKVGIQINDTLYNKYLKCKKTTGSGMTQVTTITEPPVTDSDYYSDSLWNEYKNFSDTAVFVVGRTGSEGSDLPHGYLQLNDTEKALLEQIESRFDKVYVLINAANAMELGFLNDDKIDGALLLNFPGNEGALSVGRIMTGKVDPSGKTTDIYSYDHTTSPSYNCSSLEATRQYTGINEKMYYIDYKEGVYVGYRYYETAAADGYIDYSKTVQYPFGYGLSYTTFTQKITSCSPSDNGSLSTKGSSDITVKVKVTNTGSVAGKDVVELYDTPPYTKGGIEKSSVNLVAFGKTSELQPGKSETLTLTFETQDLASFDDNDANHNGHKGYELDPGKYVFSLRSDSHTVLDSFTLNCKDMTNFDTDTTTGSAISPLFADVSGSSESTPVTYLSRNDWAGTWPKSDGKTSTQVGTGMAAQVTIASGRAVSSAETENTLTYYKAHYADKDNTSVAMPTTGAKNGLTMKDMVGLKYDDPKWNKLLDEMSVSDMQTLIGQGGYQFAAVSSIGLSKASSHDGPAGISPVFGFNGAKASAPCYGFPCETTLACTWNVDLAQQMGQAVGMEAKASSVTFWYAPAMDTHRTPYGGRDFEYYSEDGLLAGKLGAYVVKGCSEKGLTAMAKHFALNDQETCRDKDGLFTWATEQSMREVYLKPFEITVKEGGCKAVMCSIARVGAVWTGASKALMTDLLRTQWGFRGLAETDMYIVPNYAYMSLDMGIRGGCNSWLQPMGNDVPSTKINEAASVAAMRESCHGILYAEASANTIQSTTPLWSILLISGQVVVFLLLAFYVFMVFFHKSKKGKNKEQNQ